MSLKQRWREWRQTREEQRAAVEEMEFHVGQETQHNILNGMQPAEARRAALRAFGGVDRFAEAARDERTGTKLTDFAMSYLDWKLGARMLLKHPGLSVIGCITLAAAIGLGAGWFEMALLMFDPKLPLDDGDRIVRIDTWDAAGSELEPRVLHDFFVWRRQLSTIEQVGAYRSVERNLITPDGASPPVSVAEISPSAFPLTRVPPLLGRPLTEADAVPGAADVVVIGHDVWQRRFGGDARVVGREVRLGGTVATVVGVMPEGFGFPISHSAWVPLRATSAQPRTGAAVSIFGRLAPGATLETANAEVAAIGARLAADYPQTHTQLRPRVLPFAATMSSGAKLEALLVTVAAWLLLAAAAVNVATLMLARTAMRQSEIVVRNALGASRLRIMGQLFTEALVLTSLAACVGLVGARLVIGYVFHLNAERQQPLPFWYEAGLEPITLLYTAALAIFGAALVGLLPALRATGRDVQASLTRVSTGSTNMRFGGFWSLMIVLQVAFSVLCLPFAVAAAHDAIEKRQRQASFPIDAFLTFQAALDADDAGAIAVEPDADAQRARTARTLDELARRLRNEPAVLNLSYGKALPATWHPLRQVEAQRAAGAPFLVPANTDGQRVRIGHVGSDWFDMVGQPLVAGRTFRAGEVNAAPDAPTGRVVVINEAMARNIGGNPVGTRVRFAAEPGDSAPGEWHEVIGIVRNLGLTPTAAGEADYMYLPLAAAAAPWVVVRVNGDAAAFAPRLRAVALQTEPELRLNRLLSLGEVIRREELSTIHATLGGIGVVLLAIILSAASLHALMAVSVAQRTREIGVRLAIGASHRAVLHALFSRAAKQVGAGIIVGNALVVTVMMMSTDQLQPAAMLPPILIASLVMAAVGLGACFVPARRALRVQPTQALKGAQ